MKFLITDLQSQYSVNLPTLSFGSHDPELDANPEELFRQGNIILNQKHPGCKKVVAKN